MEKKSKVLRKLFFFNPVSEYLYLRGRIRNCYTDEK